jgi:hypothetical protein
VTNATSTSVIHTAAVLPKFLRTTGSAMNAKLNRRREKLKKDFRLNSAKGNKLRDANSRNSRTFLNTPHKVN